MEIGLSLGSNRRDRLANLSQAKARIAATPGVRPLAQSPVYETAPVGVPAAFAAMDFLNAVLIVETDRALRPLMNTFRQIEHDLGRETRPIPNAPRTLDIDVIYADAMRIREPDCTIPHPRWMDRRFVLQPLSDVRPNLVLPGQTKTVAELLAALPGRDRVTLFTERW